MRVAILRTDCFPEISGAARMAEQLAAELAARGHEARLVTTDPASLLDRAIEGAAIPTPIAAWSSSALDAALGTVDVVHAIDLVRTDHARAGLAFARACDAAFVVTPATAATLWEEPEAARDLCRAADAVHVLTAAEQQALAQAGVEQAAFVRTGQGAVLVGRPDPAAFRTAHGVDGPLVLFLGRKLRSKGVLTLLEAAPRVWEVQPRTRFLFAGPPSDPVCADALARSRDARIRDLGQVDETTKHSALAACDALCLPTTADVAPLAFVEAWACGAPVVSGRYEGVEDVVRDGVNGLVAEAAPGPIAAALVRVLGDPPLAERLRQGGARDVASRHSWARVADALEQRYAALCARRKEPAA